jgi:hypothetical protein
MYPWGILDGRRLATKAYIADIVTQVNDKTSDVYSDKPAPSWLSQHFEDHMNEEQEYGAHGNMVCFCPLCLVDVAKADTFVAANIGSGTRKRILRCTENVKFDVLAEYFKAYMKHHVTGTLPITDRNAVSMDLSTLLPKRKRSSAPQ